MKAITTENWNGPKPLSTAVECARLSRFFRQMLHGGSLVVDYYEILRSLREKKILFVVIGMYGVSKWLGFARATKDIDILVKGGRNFARALKTLRALYPSLIVREAPGLTALFNEGEKYSAIDLIYPHSAELQETLETGIWMHEKGIDYRIPTLEAALANKYGAMLNLARDKLKRARCRRFCADDKKCARTGRTAGSTGKSSP